MPQQFQVGDKVVLVNLKQVFAFNDGKNKDTRRRFVGAKGVVKKVYGDGVGRFKLVVDVTENDQSKTFDLSLSAWNLRKEEE